MFNVENLSVLEICNSDFTFSFIQRISEEAVNLTVLNISGCNKIKYLYKERWFYLESLELPSLIKLIISNCESLEYISINTPNLLNIEINSLPKLNNLTIYDTKTM